MPPVFKFAIALTALPLLSTAASAQTAAPAAAPTAAKEDPTQRVVCRRFVETGSIAKVRKECHTAAEWQRAAENNRQNAKDLVYGTINSTSTSN